MSYLTDYYAQTPRGGQAFGAPRDGGRRTHTGADFSHSTKPGTIDVPAVEAGVVTGSFWTSGYGWRLEIGPWSYSHLQVRSPLKVGDRARAGSIVGQEGVTGLTSGPCCHVEYVQNGRRVDPVPVIRSVLSSPAGGGSTTLPTPPIKSKQGDDDMRVVKWTPSGTLLAFAPGQVRAFGPGELTIAAEVRDVTGRDETTPSKFYEVDNTGLGGLCEAFGVPFNEGVMAAVNGDAFTIAGGKGGRFWSRDYAAASR